MKVFKIEIMVVDFDGLGEAGIISTVENLRRLAATVQKIESRDVEWSDDHPINNGDTSDAEYQRLFSQVPE